MLERQQQSGVYTKRQYNCRLDSRAPVAIFIDDGDSVTGIAPQNALKYMQYFPNIDDIYLPEVKRIDFLNMGCPSVMQQISKATGEAVPQFTVKLGSGIYKYDITTDASVLIQDMIKADKQLKKTRPQQEYIDDLCKLNKLIVLAANTFKDKCIAVKGQPFKPSRYLEYLLMIPADDPASVQPEAI